MARPHLHLLEARISHRGYAGQGDVINKGGVVTAGTVKALELIVCDPAVTVNAEVE